MQITWLGHAAFLVETSTRNGLVRLITDPFSTQSGYDAIDERAHLVTLSHDNPKYHSCLDDISGNPQIVRGLDFTGREIESNGIRFGAIRVFENAQGEGPNAMVWFQSEDLRVLHMGDVGHALSAENVTACGAVDVLLAPAGGAPTIALPDLMRFIEQLHPRLVIPMHYGTEKVDMSILPVEQLCTLFAPELSTRESTATLEITRETLAELPQETSLCVLQHAR